MGTRDTRQHAAAAHVVVDARMARISGIGTYIEEVVPRVVTGWPEARFTILGDPDLLARAIPPDARIRYVPLAARIYSLREQVALPRAIPEDATLFWSPHFNIPLRHAGRMAVTVHDVFHLAYPGVPAAMRAMARIYFTRIVRHARVVCCDSAFTARELERLAGKANRAEVIHLGVGERWFDVPRPEPPATPPYFLAVGNVKPHKNLRRLVRAFAHAAADFPHRLVIVGPRAGLRTLDRDVESMTRALGGRVVFTGRVERAELEHWVAGCAALIQPSLYEGFGLPPLEALACGRPVAVSRTASLPEVCGDEAEYFDPMNEGEIADVLRRLAARDDTPAAQASRREWARTFDWDTCALGTRVALQRAARGR